LRWKLQTIELSETFIKQELQAIITKYLKKWTGLNKSSNSSLLYMSKKHHGLDNVDIVSLWKAGVISKHHILKYSRDSWIQETYKKNEEKQLKLKGFNGYSGLSKFESQLDKSNFISKFNERKQIGRIISKQESEIRLEQLEHLKKQLQAIITKYLKKWTGLNKSSNSSLLYMSKKHHGLGNVDIVSLWKAEVISKHHILKYSRDSWIQETYK
jgi:ribosomal protein S24E